MPRSGRWPRPCGDCLLMTPPDTRAAGPRRARERPAVRLALPPAGAAHAREFTRMLPHVDRRLPRGQTRVGCPARPGGDARHALHGHGPTHGGTSAVLLTDSAGNDGGAAGETVYARGGPGALAAALAAAARPAGVEVRTAAEVVAFRDDDESIDGRGARRRRGDRGLGRGQRPGSATHAAGPGGPRDARSRARLGGRQPARSGRHGQGEPGARRAAIVRGTRRRGRCRHASARSHHRGSIDGLPRPRR